VTRQNNEDGQTLIIVAIGLTAILGFMALATDVGIQFRNRRLAQTAADASAMAGASQMLTSAIGTTLTTDINAVGEAAAAQNGFTNGSGGATVYVGPPEDGPYAGNASYVEAIVTQSSPTIFMAILGRNAMTVSAEAVTTLGNGNNCIYALSTSGTGVTVQNDGSIDIPGCGVQDNSNLTVNEGGTITARSIGVSGSSSGSSIGSSTETSPAPVYNIAPTSNPLAYLNNLAPSYNVSSCSQTLTLNEYSNPPVSPSNAGTYVQTTPYSTPVTFTPNTTYSYDGNPCYGGGTSGGIVIDGGTVTLNNPTGVMLINGSLTVDNGATANLGCGLYYITGNLTATGNGFNAPSSGTTGCGVTFYVMGNIDIGNGGQNISLIAPTSGTYNGILFWQPESGTTFSVNGGSNTTMEGVVYAPNTAINLNNGSSSNIYLDVVGNTINMQGAAELQSYQSLPGTSNPFKAIKLVE
jgi:hypothetical protein